MAITVPPKLRNLILFISREMERTNHAGRGRIKLSKLLWRCDFAAYWLLGEPITEAQYVADTLGPKPAGERELIDQLIDDGDFEWEEGFDQQKIPKALSDPDLSAFTALELEIIERQLEEHRTVTGGRMKDDAHEFVGWKLVYREDEYDRPLPYASVHWDKQEPLEPWEEEHAASLTIPTP